MLSAFERSFPPALRCLVVYNFESEIPWEELKSAHETEWAKKILPGMKDVDLGGFELVRGFGKKDESTLIRFFRELNLTVGYGAVTNAISKTSP